MERTGDYYIGELKDGKFEGKGELEIIGISKYKGEFKNDLMNGKGILNDYEKRQNLINEIVNACVKYKLDGINIDFENMKQEDKDMYSRFII